MANVPDLAKLRIDRDAPSPAVKRALRRALWLGAAALAVSAGIVLWALRGATVPIQVVTASVGERARGGGGGGGGGSGATVGIVANGYVVARTKAAVAAKIPGRLATLAVSEGSHVERGEVIARLENADYAAAVTQAEAQLATARATLVELATDRDQLQRESARLHTIHQQNANLVSPQDVEVADSRAQQ